MKEHLICGAKYLAMFLLGSVAMGVFMGIMMRVGTLVLKLLGGPV